jgi:DNA-binding XRE family transcriptional regulator
LAHKIGCSDPTIARIEKGYSTDRIFVEKLARIFGVDIESLSPWQARCACR